MKKTLIPYFCFVLACIAVIAAFITAVSLIQLTVAILLYPVLVFFGYKFLPLRKRVSAPHKKIEDESPVESEMDSRTEKRKLGISDVDKRVFLKLIGGAGVFLFLFSLFNKKSESTLFRSIASGPVTGKVALENLKGEKIDPAQNQPLDGYRISEVDDDTISFYGYTNKEGAWFVMRIDTDSGSFRYYKGTSNFPKGWNDRKKLEYDYYNNIFS